MPNTKDIQRRIKSVANTKKITRAMEMVAAAKMRKAIEAVLSTRTYANLAWETLLNLKRGYKNGIFHPLLEDAPDTSRQAVIVITSNRGLCGGFNSALLSMVRSTFKDQASETDIILIGKKGANLRNDFTVAAQFDHPEAGLAADDILPIVKFAINGFLEKRFQKIFVAYTDYINAARQIPRVRQLLPVVTKATEGKFGLFEQEDQLGISEEFIQERGREHTHAGIGFEYIFEPTSNAVLEAIVPRLLEVQLYQALLESSASEHSARMNAMHQATEAASDLGVELTLFYNKARQSAITAEIAEITAGVAALE